MKIGMADTGVFDVDKHLVRAGLADGDLLVFDGAARLLEDLGPLLFRNFRGHCFGVGCFGEGVVNVSGGISRSIARVECSAVVFCSLRGSMMQINV